MNPITNQDQFEKMVNEVLDELEDLRAAIEIDEEFMGDALVIADFVERDIQGILNGLASDNYEFGCGENMPFVEKLKRVDDRLIPFGEKLAWINEVHRDGFRQD